MKTERNGFTIVELLIAVVVIAILAAITAVSYNGITARSKAAKADSELALLDKAIRMARINSGDTLRKITAHSTGFTSVACVNNGSVHPSDLNKSTHQCWVDYRAAIDKIAAASNLSLDALKAGDANGAPYFIDENEGIGNSSSNPCRLDVIGAFMKPLPGVAFSNGDAQYGGSIGPNWLSSYKLIPYSLPEC